MWFIIFLFIGGALASVIKLIVRSHPQTDRNVSCLEDFQEYEEYEEYGEYEENDIQAEYEDAEEYYEEYYEEEYEDWDRER
ncbi:MAG: hypothetical protein ACI30I_10500 [Parabacteroides sp.]